MLQQPSYLARRVIETQARIHEPVRLNSAKVLNYLGISAFLSSGTLVAKRKGALGSSDLPSINNKDVIVEDSRRRKDATN